MTLDLAAIYTSLKDSPNVSQGPILIRIIWTLLALSILVIGLRLYAKLTTAKRIYVDDWLMVTALFFAIVHASLIQIAVNNGFGKHIIHISLTILPTTMKVGALSLFFGILSPMFGRVSFSCTLLYLTGTDPTLTFWPWFIWAVMGLQVSANVVGVVVFYCQCGKDLDVFWTFEKQLRFDEYCWNPQIQTDYGYFVGTLNTLTDIWLAVLPAVLVHRTKMRLRRKVGVAGLLCLSLLASFSSAVKTVEASNLSKVTDYTFTLSTYVVAMAVELNLVIITASIPFLRPLFRWKHWRNRVRTPTPSSLRSRRNRSDLPGLHQLPRLQPWSSHIPLSSGFTSKNVSRTNVTELSCVEGWADGGVREVEGVILVTTEVEVSYQRMEKPFVHAAIVGLIQGELQNPRLRQI